MARKRKRNDRTELIRCVVSAKEIVNIALPADVTDDSPYPPEPDRFELRKIAFAAVLRELLDYET